MRSLVVTAACALVIPVGISIVAEYWPKRETEDLPALKAIDLQESRGRDWARLPEAAGDWKSVTGKWSVIKVDYVNDLDLTLSDPLIENPIQIDFRLFWATFSFASDDKGDREELFPVKFYPDESPKRFELVGRNGEEVLQGIYKLTELDQLVIAIAPDLEDQGSGGNGKWNRPTRFDSNGTLLILCRRIDEVQHSMKE